VRVLFVDDEPRVLEAIERSLFALGSDWQTAFVESGADALAELDRAAYDVIVTDMRMPAMTGATLLHRVCQHHPKVVRIVLSGQIDDEAALGAVHVAHQFLVKPCDGPTLRGVIERTRTLTLMLDQSSLRAAVGKIDRLPSPPRLYVELSRLLGDEHANVDEITDVVRQDPAMASKLLQLVNSSFFSRGSATSDMRTAVVRLGLRTLKNLALGVGVFDASTFDIDERMLSVTALQRRALETGLLASRIADRADADEAFSAGLMCDIGQLVLASTVPEHLSLAMSKAKVDGSRLDQAEAELFHVTHAEVGAFLLGLWGLPYRIVEAVANHHLPERNAHCRLGLAQSVWMADCLVDGREPDAEYVRAIGATERLATWKHLAENMERQ